MLPKSKKFIIAGFFTIIFIFGLAQITLAVVPDSIMTNMKITAEEAAILPTSGNLTNLIGNIIGAALSFIGVVFFVLMVFGGFMWMTAHGKEDQIKKAQGTMTSAVIGLVIVLSSFAITNFVFQNTSLAPTPVATGEKGTVDPKDVACNTAHQGWKCNDIGKCSGKINIPEDTPEDFPWDLQSVIDMCKQSGNVNCLYATSTEAEPKPLCETTKGENVQVCCQTQDDSQKKYDWCFSSISSRCIKLDEFGKGNCGDGTQTGYKQILGVTEKECLIQSMLGEMCVEDADCKNSITGYICENKKCVEDSGAARTKTCKDTLECKDAGGVCKDGVCTSLIENCTINTKLSGLMCGPIACGKADADVVCTSDSQCASNHCVDGKCESGAERASCAKDGDCNGESFCTSRGSTPCCLSKLEYGESCYGMNNACKSKNCDSKSGKCI